MESNELPLYVEPKGEGCPIPTYDTLSKRRRGPFSWGRNVNAGYWLAMTGFGFRLRVRQKMRPIFNRVKPQRHEEIYGVEFDPGYTFVKDGHLPKQVSPRACDTVNPLWNKR